MISAFTPLMEKYQWGTNLPYMLAGANRIPQKEVMDWVTNRVYSFNSIVRALENRKNQEVDNAKYPILECPDKFEKVLIVGGGNSVEEHLDGIRDYIANNDKIAVVFATARHARLFNDVQCPRYYALVGRESRRMAANVDATNFADIAILPPYPRTMGTDVPEFAKSHTFELKEISFTSNYQDSCTTLAIQTAIEISQGDIYLVGYDGYPGNILSEKEMALSRENRTIFEAYEKELNKPLISLTPSLYKELIVKSVYQYI